MVRLLVCGPQAIGLLLALGQRKSAIPAGDPAHIVHERHLAPALTQTSAFADL
jgi:hypothetical protein